ncbi:MAG TPA: 6,7-dimethyl-8-ribityllumazine synthase [Candidatus Didemnitutus sp.]|nr:6,7-dimethyl-8-ribityllumazine synthase [Candidatus Didemnitutus sp.]
MSRHNPAPLAIDGTPYSIGIACARFNPALVDGLLARVTAGLERAGVKSSKIETVRVPGSNELPVAAHWLAGRGHDCIVALGVLLQGGTSHAEVVAQGVTLALQRVAVDRGLAVINGVVVANTWKQAADRCTGRIDRGSEFARAALEMAALRREIGGLPR